MLKSLIISMLGLLMASGAFAQKKQPQRNTVPVTQEVMDYVYQQSRTPYKYGMVVAPKTNKEKYDCPTVFRAPGGDKWLMTFVCYNGSGGTDGRGYETWLAESQDLLHWDIKGRVLEYPTPSCSPRGEVLPADTVSLPSGEGRGGVWDQNQRGGFPALIDYDWGGSYEMQQYKGRSYITYIGGAGRGYEAVEQPLSIGIASTDKDISVAHPWQCELKPLMSYNDKDAQWWEQLTQYKSTVYQMDKKWFGAPFVMFYNAGGKDETHPKGERIGVATSKDMKHWKRYAGNPVFAHDSDGTITGDAQIVWMPLTPTLSLKGEGAEKIVSNTEEGNNKSNNKTPSPFRERDGVRGIWVMYYFSAFNPTREYNAYNTFAVSSDLKTWTDWNGPDLIVPSKPYDELFAHKSYVVNWNGTVYHFYCAVNNSEQRGIAVATSKPLGKSETTFPEPSPTGKRISISLNKGWELNDFKDLRDLSDLKDPKDLKDLSDLKDPKDLKDLKVLKVLNVPFNLDDYYGTHQSEHGNLHGEATFTRHFTLDAGGHETRPYKGKRFFLRFEGVGTYADITLNGKHLGKYDIGRLVKTIDVTNAINRDGDNELTVKVSHPSHITDMPWVCGGCSSEWGFSEGSQPFGIFRPVTLEITDEVRIEPFGTHIWSNEALDSVFVETEVKNYGDEVATFQLVSKIADKSGKQFARLTDDITLAAGEARLIRQQAAISNPVRWTQEKPYLYTLQSMIKRNGKATDDYPVQFGFRTASWPSPSPQPSPQGGEGVSNTSQGQDKQHYSQEQDIFKTLPPQKGGAGGGLGGFRLNDTPVYINGVCEYEHLYGQSHAFQPEQIDARIKEVKAAGFNAFRDAHQPHNLRYGDRLQEEGILWWPQFSAHIWYDTPQFRESFKRHLVQWVKERRNNPAVILWGLQNESTLPKDFAEECSDIIRSLDPTCGTSRLITTCNGGEGTDWNVVQNWSGTYGGDVNNYGNELKRPDQLLNGEYGAWRTLGNHSGHGYTEEKQADLLEKKCQQAESVKDSICGQFLWLLGSHDNPGRRQPDESFRRVDKVGPFNYKGLFTPWEQPVSSFYMYKSRYTPVEKEPVVYIVRDIYQGHQAKNGIIDSLRVYSNCPEVTLTALETLETLETLESLETLETLESLKTLKTLKTLKKPANSSLFVFRNIPVGDAKLLRAEANGAYDEIELLSPDSAPCTLHSALTPQVSPDGKLRINCGGDTYIDPDNNIWNQDSPLFSTGWRSLTPSPSPTGEGSNYSQGQGNPQDISLPSPVGEGQGVRLMPVASQTTDLTLPVEELYKTARFGRHNLSYIFNVEKGKTYTLNLYFTEMWYGASRSEQTDCEGLRIFDVAINDSVVIEDLDIWAQAGYGNPYRRTIKWTADSDQMRIHFPEVKAGQAIISAISINPSPQPSPQGGEGAEKIVSNAEGNSKSNNKTPSPFRERVGVRGFWQSLNTDTIAAMPDSLLPPKAASALQVEPVINKDRKGKTKSVVYTYSVGVAKVYALRFRYWNGNAPRTLHVTIKDKNGVTYVDSDVAFLQTQEKKTKRKTSSITTGSQTNAGTYTVTINGEGLDEMEFDKLTID